MTELQNLVLEYEVSSRQGQMSSSEQCFKNIKGLDICLGQKLYRVICERVDDYLSKYPQEK